MTGLCWAQAWARASQNSRAQGPQVPLVLAGVFPCCLEGAADKYLPPLPALPAGPLAAPTSGTWCSLCPSPTAPWVCGSSTQPLGAGCGQEQGGEPAACTEPAPQQTPQHQAPGLQGLPWLPSPPWMPRVPFHPHTSRPDVREAVGPPCPSLRWPPHLTPSHAGATSQHKVLGAHPQVEEPRQPQPCSMQHSLRLRKRLPPLCGGSSCVYGQPRGVRCTPTSVRRTLEWQGDGHCDACEEGTWWGEGLLDGPPENRLCFGVGSWQPLAC